jgi:hypothetical protein
MAVLFIVQRMESLSHAFVFAGLWLYVWGRQRQLAGRPGWLAILIGLGAGTVIGALAKESAVMLPLYAFCAEACLFHFKNESGTRDRRMLWLYAFGLYLPALVGGSWLLQRSLRPGAFGIRNFGLIERLLTEPRVLLDYLHWTVLPDLNKLGLYHDDYQVSRSLLQPASTLWAMLALAFLFALALAARNRRPLFALGIAWFFSAQVLTASFLPLELVFEHRNYFASLGLMLAVVDMLLLLPATKWRRVGWITTGLLLVWYGSATGFRAWQWSNPLRFALNEVANHPMSPRAAYHLGQTYVIASDQKPNSPFTQAAIDAFERARTVPNGNILPAQGLLLLAARTGRPLKPDWWREIDERLRDHSIGPQEHGAMAALTDCAASKKCRFPVDEMNKMFAIALHRGDDPETINLYASFVLNVLDQPELALRLWKLSAQMSPQEPVYRTSVIKLLLALDRYDEARQQIAILRKMGRLGQFDRAADSLESRVRGAKP